MIGTRLTLFLGVVLITLLVWLNYGASAQQSPIGIDEQVTFYLAAGETPGSIFARTTNYAATPPGSVYFNRAGLELYQIMPALLTSKEFALRLSSLISVWLTGILLIRVGRQLFGNHCGVPAGIIFVAHFMVIEFATQARPYAVGVFASIASITCWLSAAHLFLLARSSTDEISKRTASMWCWVWLILSIVSDVLLVWSHFLFATLVLTKVLLAVFLNEKVRGRMLLLSMLAGVVVLISMVPLLTQFSLLQARKPILNWFTESRQWYQIAEPLTGPILPWLDWLKSPKLAMLTWLHWAWLITLLLAILQWARRLLPPSKHAIVEAANQQTVSGALPGASGQVVPAIMISRQPLLFVLVWLLVPSAMLFVVSQFFGSSLAQARYLALATVPASLILGWLVHIAWTSRVAWLAAILLTAVLPMPNRIVKVWNHPVEHDSYWKNAAELLNESANPNDLALVYTGLVESQLVVLQPNDLGLHEYCSSRLSKFYRAVPMTVRALPRFAAGNEWSSSYEPIIARALADKHHVFLIVSADSDIGQQAEQAFVNWLGSKGKLELLKEDRVARIYRLSKPANER